MTCVVGEVTLNLEADQYRGSGWAWEIFRQLSYYWNSDKAALREKAPELAAQAKGLATLWCSIANELAETYQIAVGRIILLGVDDDPNVTMGYGEWERVCIGRVPVGFKEGDADFGTLGATGGVKQHNHHIEAHAHGMSHVHAGPSHRHTLSAHQHAFQHVHSLSGHVHAGGPHTHDLSDHHHTTTGHSHSLNGHVHTISHDHDVSPHHHTLAHDHNVPDHHHTHAHTHTGPNHHHGGPAHTHSLPFGIYGTQLWAEGIGSGTSVTGPFYWTGVSTTPGLSFNRMSTYTSGSGNTDDAGTGNTGPVSTTYTGDGGPGTTDGANTVYTGDGGPGTTELPNTTDSGGPNPTSTGTESETVSSPVPDISGAATGNTGAPDIDETGASSSTTTGGPLVMGASYDWTGYEGAGDTGAANPEETDEAGAENTDEAQHLMPHEVVAFWKRVA